MAPSTQAKTIHEILDDLPEEDLRVYAWRMYRLEDAGFGAVTGVALAADKEVDVVRACAMLQAGCPESLVLSILT